MNKFILDQLKKVKIKLPYYDENTTQIFIQKSGLNTVTNDLEIGKIYLIYLEDYIINEPANFTLSANWNNGTKPIENKVNAQILQIMGKMVRITSQGTTTGYIWEGWVPRKAITILEEN